MNTTKLHNNIQIEKSFSMKNKSKLFYSQTSLGMRRFIINQYDAASTKYMRSIAQDGTTKSRTCLDCGESDHGEPTSWRVRPHSP